MKPKSAKINIVFDRKGTAKTKGVGLISLYCYFSNKTKTYISTGIILTPNQWDKEKKEINSEHDNYLKLNQYLRNQVNTIMNHDIDLQLTGIVLTKKRLEDFLNSDGGDSFIKYAQDQLKRSNIAIETYRSQKRSLEIFEKFAGNIAFADLTLDLLNDFTIELRKDYSENTIWKVHKDLKKYVALAIKQNKINYQANPYMHFKNIPTKARHVYLNYQELAELEKLEAPEGEANTMLNFFLFGCYTGLRFSDLSILTGRIITEREGKLVLTLQSMVKVDKRVFLRLSELFDGKAENLIRPYWEKYGDTDNIWGLKVTNQGINLALKIFQDEASLEKLLTMHVSRHTFGTLYAHQTGSIFQVMKAMGIAKFETAQVYINLSDEL